MGVVECCGGGYTVWIKVAVGAVLVRGTIWWPSLTKRNRQLVNVNVQLT